MQLYIGENIKRLRRKKGITQETLADRMHVSTAAVSKWERNETFPDIAMVIPLASYFGVSTDEILGLDVAKNEEGSFIRIIDYKSSSKNLDLNKMVTGLQIQLLTYVDIISEKTKKYLTPKGNY